jgi:AraC-like DNA-binding protein
MQATLTAPPRGHYVEVTTDHIAPAQRREFLRDTVFNRSDADFSADAPPRGFSSSTRCYVGATAELRYGTLDAGVLRRGAARCRRDGGDEFLLTALVETDDSVRYRDAGAETVLTAGQFLLTDMVVPFALEMGHFRSINFRLPRTVLTSAIPRWPARLRHGQLLPTTPLTTLLYEQIVRFAESMPAMSEVEREVAMDAISHFTIATLRLETQSIAWDEDGPDSGLWLAARRFIERHLDRADLGPELLARSLRCSRTRLYRIFARHDAAVMDHIRDTRLRRCHDMLTDPACELPIAEIASHCGMDDASSFSRGFRRRFGCSPGDVRRQARTPA